MTLILKLLVDKRRRLNNSQVLKTLMKFLVKKKQKGYYPISIGLFQSNMKFWQIDSESIFFDFWLCESHHELEYSKCKASIRKSGRWREIARPWRFKIAWASRVEWDRRAKNIYQETKLPEHANMQLSEQVRLSNITGQVFANEFDR
jgi:hypothetical protein